MKNFLIIGAGAMGSAFSMPCIDNDNKVTIVGTHLEDRLISKLKKNFYHPSLKSFISRKVNLKSFKSLDDEILSKPDYIVIAVSSKGIDWVCNQLIKNYKNKYLIILLTKGLTKDKQSIITISLIAP